MNITSMPKKGVTDWLKQRVTAFFLVIYLVLFCALLFTHQPLDLDAWQGIFHPVWFKVLSIIAFLSVVVHAWVGMWTIFTDYIHPWWLRLILMCVVGFALFAYFIWFIQILWGV
ncbi:MAG: succinate dehydrogenase, hydrophobic membrane anchor protein [Gammaproteobacteria bacterium]|nr:succinate dehydrogenase, hydrophobic membrane anchor protein [Gammaproteobacteria bacterium]MCD8542822.1 succinate dehydrogenase, hydrophobic membrane anchor protein [Gammaproteobacteria bacterium]